MTFFRFTAGRAFKVPDSEARKAIASGEKLLDVLTADGREPTESDALKAVAQQLRDGRVCPAANPNP